MKYSNYNQPLVCMQTNSTCYKGTKKMAVKGILWHSTGANNSNISRYVQPSENDKNYTTLLSKIGKNKYNNDYNHTKYQSGLNAFIGKMADGTVSTVQTMPWDYMPWGCGSGSKGSCNNGWIQFEICEDNLTNGEYFYKVYKEACELTAYLCQLYNLNPLSKVNFNGVSVPVILCHQDSYQLKLGSNHGDVLHWFNKYGKTMDDVRKDVANLIGINNNTQPIISTSSETILKKGSKGPEVEQLQTNLIKLGYFCGKSGADGDFGVNTYNAVVKFQTDNNLEPDGIVGPLTQKMIQKCLANIVSTNEIYRVRLSWDNIKSQIGAYKDLNHAKQVVDNLGYNYHVYNSKGQELYPVVSMAIQDKTILKTVYNDVMLASASKDEKGKYVGGAPGDQTGKEVYILNWYSQNWNYVLRPTTDVLAEKIAKAAEQGCFNDNIGYSQSARNTLYVEALKVGLDLSKIATPCNCDCSSFVSTCCICAGLPANIFYQNNNMRTTYNMVAAAKESKCFNIYSTQKYIKEKTYLKRGDILLNSNQHVVIVLSDGEKVESKNNSQPSVLYKVKVTAKILNVRAQPNTVSKIKTTVKQNEVFSIIETKNNWGKLKSGAGWIDLSYTKKV